ncbi:L-serine ammonia-lyase [Mesorhizobium sp. WSM4887]|uniref:L-serine ammonia-lyase n=1 Tax=Mesorhizobium sp. WSM4887 TaxID=3038543 RepID=UPI0024176535|nr:L-serine ammonia-lyase [Mesorhizobium sp. WSM4887]MDG4886815.1 L-serine ammonia-lyase [Mesorhizobium sp. WSM4887]
MFISVFDIFKVGIGPSSSHTMGPMIAAGRFLELLRSSQCRPRGLRVTLYGSLAFTGKGHGTDRAIILGLAGLDPRNYKHDDAEQALTRIGTERFVEPPGLPRLHFNPNSDLNFDFGPPLSGHANGLRILAVDHKDEVALEQTFYSIGGGFVLTPDELAAAPTHGPNVDYPFRTATEMLDMTSRSGLSIAQMKYANELSCRTADEIDDGLRRIWQAMNQCIDRGLACNGVLPGGLAVVRRARRIHETLVASRKRNTSPPHEINDWICAYAMAVNEENAAGGQVVTAPTNGAAGTLPAVVRYWIDHVPGADASRLPDFLLTAASIGGIIKHNASISGAECGCQAEVGSASAMAAGGLAAVLGGTPEQIENAAEIALEHHLGMTCDPIRGLVQIPCIERNGLGAIKAVAAASLALRGNGRHFVPLDACIEAMRQTGKDMNEKYKETALGGLAVNVPNC